MIYPDLSNQPSLWRRDPVMALFLYGTMTMLMLAFVASIGLFAAVAINADTTTSVPTPSPFTAAPAR